MVEDEHAVYTDPDGKVWHPHRGYWCWKVSSELAQAQDRIKELEARLAEAKAALEKIAGSHWGRVGYCQTDIDDVPDLTAEEAMLTARRALSALEATPPAPKVADEFRQYRRKQIAELRPWQPGECMVGVSVSTEDIKAGSPKAGDMIARNPKNHDDQWLVSAAYFADNFEPLPTLTAAQEAGKR